MTKYQKISLVLPAYAAEELKKAQDDIDKRYLQSIIISLRQEGWTLASIAEPLNVSREWIRQIESNVEDTDSALRFAATHGFTAPERPSVPELPKIIRPMPEPETLKRLKQLQPYAQKVRANSPQYRAEAEEYTRLLYKEHNDRGVSIYRLAKELGVTHGALRFRLVRYGYHETDSSSKVYKPILDKNRMV